MVSGKGSQAIQGSTEEAREGRDKKDGERHTEEGRQAEGGYFEVRSGVSSDRTGPGVPAEDEGRI